MASVPMPIVRFDHPPPLMQISFMPFGCPPLISPNRNPQLNSMMPVPYRPPLRPPSLDGNPQNVQTFPDSNIISRKIYYGSDPGADAFMKDNESSIQACQKRYSLTKASQASKSTEVSVTEKFCNIAKEHGLIVELVTNEEYPETSRKESHPSPLNSTQPKLQSFDSFQSEALDKKKHLNPLVDEYVPHASLCPGKESNVDLVLKQHPATEENTVDDSVKCEPVTEENLSITKSVSGKDVRDPSGSNFDGGYQPSSALQTIPPLRPLLLPIMPKVKKMRTLKDAIVQTDNDGKPDSRLCPNCQRKSSDSDKCTATLVFKNINLEQKTKYLALHASFLMRESSEVTKSQDELKKMLNKKLQMLYKQFGKKDTGVSHWEDELICQVVISLLNDSPGLASPDQNSILLARLREEVNILNEITASLLEESPGKITEISEPQLNSELKNPLLPTVAIRTEESLSDNPYSATKSALMSCQGSAIMAETMHLSNSSSGVSLSSADLSTGPAISAVVLPTALTDYKVGTVSVSKNYSADPIQEDPTPKSGGTNVVDDKTVGPLSNKVIQPNQISLQQFLDTLDRSHNTEQKTFPTSVASENSTTDHLQHKKIIISVEQKGNESIWNPENIKSIVDSHDLDNRQLKGTSSASKTYAMLLSPIGNRERKNQGFKPLVIRPLDKNYKFKAPDHSQDSNDSPCKEAPKSGTFENIERADKLRSRSQSETSDLSDKDTHFSLTTYKPKAVQETVNCEVDNQIVDLKKSPGRLSQFKTPEHPTDTWLKAKPISLHNKISSDQTSRTLSTLNASNNSISDVRVPNTFNPLMQSHNLMLNPPLSVTALAGFISNVSNSGSSSVAVFPTSVSNQNTLCQKSLTKSSFPNVGHLGNTSVSSAGNAEASERNSMILTGDFSFDNFVKQQRMLQNPALRPRPLSCSYASSCAAASDVFPQLIPQIKVQNVQQPDRGYDQASLRETLELQTQQENEELINLREKYVHLMMKSLQNHSTYGTSKVNFSDSYQANSLANSACTFPGSGVHKNPIESMSEVNNKNIHTNFEDSVECEINSKVGITFSPSLNTPSERSDEGPLKKLCKKAPLDVRVRKVSSKGLQSVKDWVIGNVESTHKSVASSRSTVERQIESHSGHSRIKAPNTSTADNQYHEAVEENSFASHKYLTPFDKKRMSTLSPQEQKISNDFNIEDMTKFEKATHLPENKKYLYTPQSLLNKYCYSSVAARFIALESAGTSTFPPWSNVSNATPERDSYATMAKKLSPLKTLTIVSSESICLAATPLNKCPWKEGDNSSWKGKTSSHSSINNKDFQTEKPLIVSGDHDEDMQAERMLGNVFDQDTEAPQTGDCKIDLTLWNSKNQVKDNSAKKSIERQDWFDIDNISLSESFSSLIRDEVYTGEDMPSCSSVLNNIRANEKSMNGSDEVHHNYVTNTSKHSALECINWWDETGNEKINRNTDQIKQDTKKSSGDESLVWMTVTNTRKQKVSINDRIQEFRQQDKYKNLTTRILEIYKNLSREEAQDILETVFTMTDGMTGMRQHQILSEVHAALTEIYPEKMIVQKEVNLNISAKYSTVKSSKNTQRQSKSINKSKQSIDSSTRSSWKVPKCARTTDNISSASDSDSSDKLLRTSEQNNEKQVYFEHTSYFSPIFPKVVSNINVFPKNDSNKKFESECLVFENADEAVQQCTEIDLTRSNNLMDTDNALAECYTITSTEQYVPEHYSLDITEFKIPVCFNTYSTVDAVSNAKKAIRTRTLSLSEDEEDHYFKKACSIQ